MGDQTLGKKNKKKSTCTSDVPGAGIEFPTLDDAMEKNSTQVAKERGEKGE